MTENSDEKPQGISRRQVVETSAKLGLLGVTAGNLLSEVGSATIDDKLSHLPLEGIDPARLTIKPMFGDHVVTPEVFESPRPNVIAGELDKWTVLPAWYQANSRTDQASAHSEASTISETIRGFVGTGTSTSKAIEARELLARFFKNDGTAILSDTSLGITSPNDLKRWEKEKIVRYFVQTTAAWYLGIDGLTNLLHKLKDQGVHPPDPKPDRREFIKKGLAAIGLTAATAVGVGSQINSGTIEGGASNTITPVITKLTDQLITLGVPEKETRLYMETIRYVRSLNMLIDSDIGSLVLQKNIGLAPSLPLPTNEVFMAGVGHADIRQYVDAGVNAQEELIRGYAKDLISHYLPDLTNPKNWNTQKYEDAYQPFSYLTFLGYGVPRLVGKSIHENFRQFELPREVPPSAFLIYLQELNTSLKSKDPLMSQNLLGRLISSYVNTYMPVSNYETYYDAVNYPRNELPATDTLSMFPNPFKGASNETLVARSRLFAPYEERSFLDATGQLDNYTNSSQHHDPVAIGYTKHAGIPIPIYANKNGAGHWEAVVGEETLGGVLSTRVFALEPFFTHA